MHDGRISGVKPSMISKASQGSTKIIRIARAVCGEGFVDMIDEEVEEHQEVLTNDELEDLVKSSTEEEEEIKVEPAMWTLDKKKIGEMFRVAQNLRGEK
jgi:hypothetical protein